MTERRAESRQMDNISGTLNEIFGLLRGLGERQAVLETRVGNELASREWVSVELAPLRESGIRMEHAIEKLGEKMEGMAEGQTKLYNAHNELMKQRAENEQKESAARIAAAESQTFTAMVKSHWQPLGAFVLTLVAVATLLGSMMTGFLSTQGFVREPQKGIIHVATPRPNR